MLDGPYLHHLLDPGWEKEARTLYRAKYDDMKAVFKPRISYGFYTTRTSPDPETREYLTRVVIDNLRLVGTHHAMRELLDVRGVGYWTSDRARTFERAGEVVMLYTALFGDKVFASAGRRSFQAAAALLRDHGTHDSRLILDEELGDRFDAFVSVLESSGLSDTEIEHYSRRMRDARVH